jgi:hypothetical protein
MFGYSLRLLILSRINVPDPIIMLKYNIRLIELDQFWYTRYPW